MKRIIISLFLLLSVILPSGCSTENQRENNKSSTATQTTSATSQSTSTVPTTTEKNGELSGFKVLIDAGHGCTEEYVEPKYPGATETTVENSSTGATGVATHKREGELTLQVALLLQKSLEKLGADVHMVRTTEGTPMSLRDRAEMGNKLKVDLAFRIHADGIEDSSVRGASLLYPAPDYVGEKLSKTSKKASEIILKNYIKATEFNDRGTVARNDLVGFNFSKVPTVLIELGFMTNPDEDRLMFQKAFQKKMVEGIAKGIIEYKKSK
ncbi:MAG: N-acetylmuramoyl-L-alanine amidase [Oscillospiraceae bacterium]|nr:N-acetylmuramoyl-L-alanine amidase [Oscillospiraceae bacterium]